MLLVTIPACVLSVQIRSYSTLYFPYSVRMRENADKNNSEYEHFSCSAFHESSFRICNWIFQEGKKALYLTEDTFAS